MKVIIHSDEYYPTCAACTYRMKVFADTFVQNGDSVTVIASATNLNGKSHRNMPGERIIYAPAIRMRKKTTLMRLLNNVSFAVTSVIAAAFAGPADVVITTSPPPLISISGWLIARLKGAKLVYDVRDIWPEVALEMKSFSEDSIYCRVFRMITNFMYRHADLITTVSPGKVEKLKNKLPDHRERVHLVSNGFDRSILAGSMEENIVEQYHLDERFTCVYIGNIGLAQGLDMVLDLAGRSAHRDIQFLIFGKGAEKERLERKARENHLDNVKFCGVLDHSKVYTVLNKSKISIIPLKNENMKDSIPTKIYESLGLGCPVFLIAEGDSCRIVEKSGLGVCVSPSRKEEIASEFDRMIDSYDQLESKREKSKRLMYSEFSRQAIADQFERELHTMIEQEGAMECIRP